MKKISTPKEEFKPITIIETEIKSIRVKEVLIRGIPENITILSGEKKGKEIRDSYLLATAEYFNDLIKIIFPANIKLVDRMFIKGLTEKSTNVKKYKFNCIVED